MKVHHLNCGTMHMPTAPMVCHVLLIETDNGLVLVDSGYGTHDCDDPKRVGPTRRMVRAILNHDETVVHQIDRLGFARTRCGNPTPASRSNGAPTGKSSCSATARKPLFVR